MTDFGITPDGFNRKQLSDILSDLTVSQRAAFGALLDTEAETELGQLNGTFASALAECWELLETAYNEFDPDAASFAALTALCALTGTGRRAAKASTSPLTLNLNAGASAPAGSIIEHSTRPDIRFTLDATVTNSGGSAANLPGTGTCTQTGPIGAIAGSLTVIITPASGWNSVTNPADATAGRDVDNDIILRQRREDQLALRGGSTVDAIRADLLDFDTHPELSGINSVEILENTTDFVDANGLPRHSFEVIIDDFAEDGITHQVLDPNAIAQAIWDTKPGGIQPFGGAFATAKDRGGNDRVVSFTYITPKPVYISAALVTVPGFPSDGIDQVKAAIVDRGGKLLSGETVYSLVIAGAGLTVAGVINLTSFKMDFFHPPTDISPDLPVGVRERATFSSLNIELS